MHIFITFCSSITLYPVDSAKELRDKAKKTKSDHKNKGYESCFEHFSVQDEEILGKCCAEVSKSLEEIFSQRDWKNDAETQDKVVVVSDEDVISPFKSVGAKSQHQGGRDDTSTETDSVSYIPEPPPRRPSAARRRSSVGALAHFVKRNSVDDVAHSPADTTINGKGVTEALQKFQFRSQDAAKLQQREMERRQSNDEYLLAHSKRKRMIDYAPQIT